MFWARKHGRNGTQFACKSSPPLHANLAKGGEEWYWNRESGKVDGNATQRARTRDTSVVDGYIYVYVYSYSTLYFSVAVASQRPLEV